MLLTVLILLATLAHALVAGTFFAFSIFVMPALARLDHRAGIAAMQSINDVILRTLFMPLFFGQPLLAAAAAAWSLAVERHHPPLLLAAAIVAFVGDFLCTVCFNVPLNNRLARLSPEAPDAGAEWRSYTRRWTRWNHVRTIAASAACALSAAAAAA